MKPLILIFVTTLLCAGCAAVDERPEKQPGQADARPENPLSQADAQLIAEDYNGAIASYAGFAAAQPEHAQAARARATQKALERLVALHTAMGRAQQTGDVTRRELTERQAETDRLKAEIGKLRADLERLRSIDLQLLQKK